MSYRVLVRILISCLLVVAASEAADDTSTPSPKLSEMQSPIALDTETSIYTPDTAYLLLYNKSIATSIKNNGHTINVGITPSGPAETPLLYGFGNVYKALSFHFHWGCGGVLGSEHELNGKKGVMEMHIIHVKVHFDTVDDALKEEYGTVVYGTLFKKSTEEEMTPGLKDVCDKLPSLTEYNSTTTLSKSFKLLSIVRDFVVREFFLYQGSLTTPTYAENVTWIVSRAYLPVSDDCLQKFCSLKDSHDEPLVNNFRALQPLNGRKVYFH